MATTGFRLPLRAAALAAACLIVASPRGAAAGGDPQGPGQPPPGKGTVVVEQVENGPLFGVEFKFADLNGRDAYLLGGYAGAIFDGRLFIGGAGYWQVNSPGDDYYGYHNLNGYGGLVLEWYAWRSPVVSVSARGLIGGGVANIGWEDYFVPDYPRGAAAETWRRVSAAGRLLLLHLRPGVFRVRAPGEPLGAHRSWARRGGRRRLPRDRVGERLGGPAPGIHRHRRDPVRQQVGAPRRVIRASARNQKPADPARLAHICKTSPRDTRVTSA